jgi:hypothetical protein
LAVLRRKPDATNVKFFDVIVTNHTNRVSWLCSWIDLDCVNH